MGEGTILWIPVNFNGICGFSFEKVFTEDIKIKMGFPPSSVFSIRVTVTFIFLLTCVLIHGIPQGPFIGVLMKPYMLRNFFHRTG